MQTAMQNASDSCPGRLLRHDDPWQPAPFGDSAAVCSESRRHPKSIAQIIRELVFVDATALMAVAQRPRYSENVRREGINCSQACFETNSEFGFER